MQEFCKRCPVCQLSQPQTVRPPLGPMIANGFLNRVQVELIDMGHNPDGDFKWIGHFMDHFSKYQVIFPLKNKTAQEVAEKIQECVLSYLGVPKIFHSENGREFVNELLQSQGLIENGNKTLEKRLAAIKSEKKITGSTPWSTWLPRIQYGLNVTVQESIKQTPYAVVFGQQPQSSFVPGSSVHIVDEEEIGEFVTNKPVPAPRKRKDPSPSDVTDEYESQPEPVLDWPVPTSRRPRDEALTKPHPNDPARSPEPEEDVTVHSTSIRNETMKNYKNNAEKMKEISKKKKNSSHQI